MRHRKAGVKLNRTTSHRQAMFRNMVTSLFKHDRIRTTDIKAKELRRWADQIITLAKRGDLHARRQVLAIVREKDVVHSLFTDVEKRFGSLHGGYTRIVKIGPRPGDNAPMSIIELVSLEEKPKKAKKKGKAGDKKGVAEQAVKASADKAPQAEAAAPDEAQKASEKGGSEGGVDSAAPHSEAKEPVAGDDTAKAQA
ncbi:MAG: 50S ribosomal protein L17 [Desulfatitalea sp.]|nr:50S ribosomal protein L17 [Desulfatitalea sp.]